MRVGFLHLGDPAHGVSRYGRLLAATARAQPGLDVVEVEADFARTESTGGTGGAGAAAEAAGSELSRCDVAHVQFNRALWGDGWAQLRALRAFFDSCRVPIVANLHDVYLDNPWAEWRKSQPGWRTRVDRVRNHFLQAVPSRRAIGMLLRRARATVVCFDCERERLRALEGFERSLVIGHFVEARPDLPSRDAARRELDVADRRVVTLLGFIHRRKGHDLLARALEHLPKDVIVVFVGAAHGEHRRFLDEIVRRAERSGCADRLRSTGRVDEPTLDRWLAATDLAVCPFRFFSASGSLATWISAARPVLCHGLPQISEYRRVAPGAFFTFDDFTPQALAMAIEGALGEVDGGPDPALIRLREEFSLQRVTAQHIELYRTVSSVAAASGR